MIHIIQKMLLLLFTVVTVKSTFALDSGIQNLTNKIGATDYFKISCSTDTSHLNFKLSEIGKITEPLEENVIESGDLSQFFNATLTKTKLKERVTDISAGKSKKIILKGGNGAYTLTLDTIGTNLNVKTAQTYSVQYECLNEKGKITKGSSTLTKLGIESINKTLKNNKTAKYSITCAKDIVNGNTSSLSVKLINKTTLSKIVNVNSVPEVISNSGNMMAQVVTAKQAKNTIGEEISIPNVNGNYDVMINTPLNKTLSYRFEYSCLNANNNETTSILKFVQDQ